MSDTSNITWLRLSDTNEYNALYIVYAKNM